MRVLLMEHLPLEATPGGLWFKDFGRELQRQGHQVQALVVDDRQRDDDCFATRRVICAVSSAAKSSLVLPGFGEEQAGSRSFSTLDETELAQYREALRRALDEEVSALDPHVIHARHIGLSGQLALESGAPYVLSAWGTELGEHAASPRIAELAEQAAENASRIFVPHAALAAAVRKRYPLAEDRLMVMPLAMGPLGFSQPQPRAQRLAELGLPADAGPIVAALGGPLPESGLDVLVNAAARYEATSSKVLTVIVGQDTTNTELMAQARRLGVAGLRVLENRDPGTIFALWDLADVVVFPGRAPANGLEILWALAAGTPVLVSTEIGWQPTAGMTGGELVADGDHELLAEAITSALSARVKATHGAAIARQARAAGTLEESVRQHVASYEALLRERFGSSMPQ